MTDGQINAAIAEACGWTEITKKAPLRGSLKHRFIASKAGGKAFIPSYCTDLNAMHEAEETLTEEQWDFMFGYLVSIRWRNASEDERRGLGSQKRLSPARATARQRAEAFLKTVGKWEE